MIYTCVSYTGVPLFATILFGCHPTTIMCSAGIGFCFGLKKCFADVETTVVTNDSGDSKKMIKKSTNSDSSSLFKCVKTIAGAYVVVSLAPIIVIGIAGVTMCMQ
jgi:hypothetical protein